MNRDAAPPPTPIRILPPAVAAGIAAGEVIERPASVVKELVENALDAGASQIRVDVRGGGLTFIRVGDDGVGIPSEQLWLACQRHATSKLPADDLGRVRTLGFRGEALPSIVAVAEVTIVSATDGSGTGRRLVVRDGQIVADEPAPRPRGTTVTVRHLFQNVPVRLAAAGRVQAETAQIAQTVRRLALTAPATRISLLVDDRPVIQTGGSGELETALVELYGPDLAGRLESVGPQTVERTRLWGFVAGPDVTRPARTHVNLVVNGRWVQPRGLLHALEAAYRPVLSRGRHPIAALVVEAPAARVDINIHPAKLEVRLLDERAIGAALGEMIRGALGRRPLPMQAPFAAGLDALRSPTLLLAEEPAVWDDDGPIVTPGLPPVRLVGQLQNRLLLLEGPAGLYLVDQHRAHERILFEHLRGVHAESAPAPITLSEPLLLELRPGQVNHFARRLDELASLGFECDVFGGRTFLVRAAPALPGVLAGAAGDALAGLGHTDELAATLLSLADGEAGEGEEWRERLLVRLACRTAVRRGRPLDRSAMRALVEGLGNTNAPAVCPHGSPLLMHVSGDILEKQFDWR